jgi:uncharacterized protein (DUF2147 family)
MVIGNTRWVGPVAVTCVLLLGALQRVDQAGAQARPVAAAGTAKPAPGDVLLGEWWTENREGRVRFSRYKDGTFRGTAACCLSAKVRADDPDFDIHNPNPKLRGRSLLGIVVVWKLVYSDGEFSGGYAYNPRDGKTYRCEVRVIDRNTIKIRGYVGIPLFGESQIWKRARLQTTVQQAAR